MGLIVDTREPAKYQAVFRAKGLKFTTAQLVTGDVIAHNDDEPEIQICLERKRIDDLVSSYYSGRIHEQFERLSEEKFAVLLVTGNLQDALRKMPDKVSARVMPQFVEEVMSLAIVQYNFRSVIWLVDGVYDVHESGYATIVKACEKIVCGKMDEIPQKKVKLSKDPRINAVRNLFGVDNKVAKQLLQKHGTLKNIMMLTDTDLLKIKGLGAVQVKRIRYILDESINKGNYETKETKNECSKCGKPMTIVKMPGGNTYICKPCTFGSVSRNS